MSFNSPVAKSMFLGSVLMSLTLTPCTTPRIRLCCLHVRGGCGAERGIQKERSREYWISGEEFRVESCDNITSNSKGLDT